MMEAVRVWLTSVVLVSVLLSAAQVVILTVYPLERRGAMMGTYGLATTAAPIIAPTLAGLMIDAFGWMGAEKVPLHWNQFAGVALMIGGVVLFKLRLGS